MPATSWRPAPEGGFLPKWERSAPTLRLDTDFLDLVQAGVTGERDGLTLLAGWPNI